jgi:hypothetical protein
MRVAPESSVVCRPLLFTAALVALVESTTQAQTSRVSVSSAGLEADGASNQAVASADGRHVAFRSEATTLVAGDTNGVSDIFVHDRSSSSTLRLSLGPAGIQANARSDRPSMSATGRFVAFESWASNLVAGDANGEPDVFVVDRDVDADGVFDEPGATSLALVSVSSAGVPGNRASYRPVLSADGRFAVFESFASNLVPGGASGVSVYRHDRQSGETIRVSDAPGGAPNGSSNLAASFGALSADGRFVLFLSHANDIVAGDTNEAADLFLHDTVTGLTGRVSLTDEGGEAVGIYPWGTSYGTLSANARTVAFGSDAVNLVPRDTNAVGDAFVRDRLHSDTRRVSVGPGGAEGFVSPRTGGYYAPAGSFPHIDSTGRYVTFLSDAPLEEDDTNRQVDVYVHDGRTGYTWRVNRASDGSQATGGSAGSPFIGSSGRFVVFASHADNLVANDHNGVEDVFVAELDADADGMPTAVELVVGLDPLDGADGSGDLDGDGSTNVAEVEAGAHPRGFSVQHLAEGSGGRFFHTDLALANPNEVDAGVIVRLDRADGTSISRTLTVPARSRRTLRTSDASSLERAAFSVTVEADVPVAADRVMSWGDPPYGSHAETAKVPATTWYLAEGATFGTFDLFYLLANPGAIATTVRVRFFTAAAASPIERHYRLPPRSRRTVWVDLVDPALAQAEVSAIVESLDGTPVLVERAMYASSAAQLFRAGHSAAGVTAPLSVWYFAEGATGPYFDCFIALFNPWPVPVAVDLEYLLPDGATVTTHRMVAAGRRSTVWVDVDHPALANAAFSLIVRARDPGSIVAERVMWWPGAAATWHEAHVAAGAPALAGRAVMAGGEVGGPFKAETYLLVANPTTRTESICVRVLFEDRPDVHRFFLIQPRRRVTIDLRHYYPETVGRRFGVLIDCAGPPEGGIVAEWARYQDAGPLRWASGMAARLVSLPEAFGDAFLFDFTVGTTHTHTFDEVAPGVHPGPSLMLGEVAVSVSDGGPLPVVAPDPSGEPFPANYLSKAVRQSRNDVVLRFPRGTRAAGVHLAAPAAAGVTVTALDWAGSGMVERLTSDEQRFLGFDSPSGIAAIRVAAPNGPGPAPTVYVAGVRYARR